MVDVSGKPITVRTATAQSQVRMNAAAAQAIRRGDSRKGDVLSVARLAAINASKWTAHLIPLCHSIPIESVRVEFDWLQQSADAENVLLCQVVCNTSAKTGIEMEAMTAASVASLTVYDMLKSVDRAIRIDSTQLVSKSGGKSGSFENPAAVSP